MAANVAGNNRNVVSASSSMNRMCSCCCSRASSGDRCPEYPESEYLGLSAGKVCGTCEQKLNR